MGVQLAAPPSFRAEREPDAARSGAGKGEDGAAAARSGGGGKGKGEDGAGALNIVIVPKDETREGCGNGACCAGAMACCLVCCPDAAESILTDMIVDRLCGLCCGLCCSAGFCCSAPWGTMSSVVLVLVGIIMWGVCSSSAIESTADAIDVVVANDRDGGGDGADSFVSAIKAFIWIMSILTGLLLLFVMFIAYTRFRMEFYKKAPRGRHLRTRNRQTQCAGVFSMGLIFLVAIVSVFVLFLTTIWFVAATIATRCGATAVPTGGPRTGAGSPPTDRRAD